MGAFSSLANVGLSAAMSRAETGSANEQLRAEAARDVAEIRARDAAERRQRERELRQRLARARAVAASSGTGSGAGSAAAVRRGIEEELREEDLVAARERELAISNIRARASARRSRNLLDARTGMTKGLVGGAISAGSSLLDL